MEEDPDKGVKEAFSEIRQVVTGQGDKEGVRYDLKNLSPLSSDFLPDHAFCPKIMNR